MRLEESSAKRSGQGYWLQFAFWCVVILAVLEIFTRLFIFKSPVRVQDPLWGAVPVENSCYRRGTEGFGVTCYAANSEIDTPYHDGLSIAVLGDSYTEALQVSNSRKFVTLTEMLLRERGYPVDLHNLGDSGNTLADLAHLAPAVNKTYAPSIVVLQTNSFGLRDSFNSRRENYFSREDTGDVKLVHRASSSAESSYRNTILSSGLLTYFAYRWDSVTSRAERREADRWNSDLASDAEIVAVVNVLLAAYPDSKVVLLLMPDIPVITSTEVVWKNLEDEKLLNVLTQIDRLQVVYPDSAFRELYEQSHVFPRGFENTALNTGHLNRFGHEAVAGALADALEEYLK